MRRRLLFVVGVGALAGCLFNLTERYACRTQLDCLPGYACQSGVCEPINPALPTPGNAPTLPFLPGTDAGIAPDDNGPQVICDRRSWCRTQQPTGSGRLNAIWGRTANEAWTVSEMGHLVRYDGRQWQVVDLVPALLFDVHGTASDDVWAVGIGGKVAHWNGTDTTLTEVDTRDLYRVRAVTRDDVWIVGSNGLSLRGHGTTWNPGGVPGTAHLRGLWVSPAGSVWVVGDRVAWFQDGSGWQDRSAGVDDVEMWDAWGTSDADVWAAGGDGTLRHWDGSAWSTVTPPGTTYRLHDVDGTAVNDVWAVGEYGRVVHFNGGEWSDIISPSDEDLRGVWAHQPGGAWAVGRGANIWFYRP
ncbi:MAG: hypothetical protein AB2A00_20695 [Myxococcota bacterium]